MTKYLGRARPKCKGNLGVVIPSPTEKTTELAVIGFCLDCGYTLPITKIILGKLYFSLLHKRHKPIRRAS